MCVFLARLCFSCVCVGLQLYAREHLYLFLFLCVRIYYCVCTSVFFMPLCASVHTDLCICIYYCVRVSRVSVCVCVYMSGSVYIYSSFRVSVFITASVRLHFSCLCELPHTAVFPESLSQ